MNNSYNQNNSYINNNNSLIKNRSGSNSLMDVYKSNIKSTTQIKPNSSLIKSELTERTTPIQNLSQPYTPNLRQNHNMTPISFNLSNLESGFTFTENIHVFLRVRPFNNTEKNRGDSKCVEVANQQTMFFINKSISRNFSFDYIFDENSSQDEVFQYSQINVFIINRNF